MSYYRSNNESNTFRNSNEYEDNKQMNPYLSPNDDQNDINLYDKYQQNQRTGGQNIYDKQQQQPYSRQFNNPNHNPNGIPAISPEDFLILRNCNKESFYYRCLPLSVAACGLIYFLAVKRNTKPAIWHYMSATFGGWFFGKLSYRKTCEEKLIKSNSDSPFVKAIRRRRGLYTEDLQSGNSMTLDGTLDSDWETESKDTTFSYGAHEFSDDKDLPQQPRNDSEDSKPQFSTTYDDLRARNRAGLRS